MKTYAIIINGREEFFKTTASEEKIEQAVMFVKMGDTHTLEKLMMALRTLGEKASPINIEPVQIFEL